MSSEFNVPRYLARIGVSAAVKPDLATLKILHAAHVNAVPYDSLDASLDRPVPLDLASLQDKLVDHRRGGYCFEQNILFKGALEAIGFKVTGLLARVRWNALPGSPLSPLTHMLLKVDLAEGTYLADVGFGINLIDGPLRLQTDVEQRTSLGTYTLTHADTLTPTGGLFSLSAKQPTGWRTMYLFNEEPRVHADYELGNWFTMTNPASIFRKNVIIERVTPTQRHKLVNRHLITEAREGVVTAEHRIDNADEYGSILDQLFGITPPLPGAEIYARLCAV